MNTELFKNLKPGQHIHIMGICGTAMASLAGLLKQKGYQITGHDHNVYPPMSIQLEKLGIPILKDIKDLKTTPDLVVVGNVMTKKHKEIQYLLASQIPYTSFPEIMEHLLIANKKSIVPCGTHGKTTSTALLSWILTQCGQNPEFLIGGIPKNFAFSFSSNTKTTNHFKEKLFIIEGDEYDSAFFDKVPKFTHYKPHYVILTSIEMDHIDIYPDLKAVKKAFHQLMQIIPPHGLLIANGEDSNVCEILQHTNCQQIKIYALSPQTSHLPPDYWVDNMQKTPQGVIFDVQTSQGLQDTIELSLFGDYNIANALAVYALLAQMPLNIIKKDMLKAFKSFLGVKRRQEIIGKPNGIVVIDDFAHHPTAVQQTIASVQEHFQNSQVISIFEPRSATSRRTIFQQAYIEAFCNAQLAIVSDIYNKDVLTPTERLNVNQLVADVQKKKRQYNIKGQIFIAQNTHQIIQITQQHVKKGDVVLIMSNGGFDGLYSKMLTALKTPPESPF